MLSISIWGKTVENNNPYWLVMGDFHSFNEIAAVISSPNSHITRETIAMTSATGKGTIWDNSKVKVTSRKPRPVIVNVPASEMEPANAHMPIAAIATVSGSG